MTGADQHSVPQVTQLRVFVSVLDVNDNPPVFPFEVKVEKVSEVSARDSEGPRGWAHGGQTESASSPGRESEHHCRL